MAESFLCHRGRGCHLDRGDLAIWMRALVGGKLFDADYQRQWLDSPTPQDPNKPLGQKYGYGISQITFGPNTLYFHGGEVPGYNSFMGYDPVNDVTLVIWTNLTVALNGQSPANTPHAEDARPDLYGIAAPVAASRNVRCRLLRWSAAAPDATARFHAPRPKPRFVKPRSCRQRE